MTKELTDLMGRIKDDIKDESQYPQYFPKKMDKKKITKKILESLAKFIERKGFDPDSIDSVEMAHCLLEDSADSNHEMKEVTYYFEKNDLIESDEMASVIEELGEI